MARSIASSMTAATGIYLTPEQWEILAGAADDIDAAVKAAGGGAAGSSAKRPQSAGAHCLLDAFGEHADKPVHDLTANADPSSRRRSCEQSALHLIKRL